MVIFNNPLLTNLFPTFLEDGNNEMLNDKLGTVDEDNPNEIIKDYGRFLKQNQIEC